MKTSKHPTLANGQPAISCFSLSPAELLGREKAAHHRAARRATRKHVPAHEAGRRVLWHAECPAGLKLAVCDEALFRLTAKLPTILWDMNGGKPLDFWDYAYVADVLRDWLAALDNPAGDVRNLRRALAWVEEKGSGKRDFSQERHD